MPLVYDSIEDLVKKARAELVNNTDRLDPTVSNNWAIAFVDSIAMMANTNNLQIRDLEKQLFPQTATDEYLDRWLEYEGLSRNAATSGRGNATITGTVGSVVPVLTQFTGSNGLVYENQLSATISDTTLSVVSIKRSGTTATAVFTESHGLASGNSVVISGAVEPDYNGTFVIIVLSETELTYTVVGSPSTPATGTILLDATYASVAFDCTTTGANTDLDPGSTLTIDPAAIITGTVNTVITGAGGFTGGADVEDDESARARLLLARTSIAGVFTPDQIKLAALTINGNTRIWVVSPEVPQAAGGPETGQVFIYFTRDNDTNPLPSSTIVDETKAAIIALGRMPAHTAAEDVVVAAPTPVTTGFIFTSITPDTATMRTAVENQLASFYEDSAQVGEDITNSSYLGSISNTFDLVNSEALRSFVLASPVIDIPIAIGELGFPGTVTFP